MVDLHIHLHMYVQVHMHVHVSHIDKCRHAFVCSLTVPLSCTVTGVERAWQAGSLVS